ncbi:MAG: hypothetical protein ABIS67_09650 [Candidatus Eisenbacteria bacterium]
MSLHRALGRAMVATLFVADLAGCSRTSMLPDATYAAQMIPIYPRAQLADQMGSNSFGEGPGESWDGMAWWLHSKDDPQKIVEFYESKLPGWQREVDETGAIVFKTVPPGGDEGEEVYVRIGNDGRIQIGESVKSSKRAQKQS